MTYDDLPDHKTKDAMRAALCKRLHEVGMQAGEPCDGIIVQCGICDRTIDAINDAALSGRFIGKGE